VNSVRGIALLAKPAGVTSFQSLGPVKRSLGTRRLGHTGTLDKFASGLLVLLVGPYTRLGPWFTGLDKLYLATLRFGEETDTLDPEGAVVATAPAPAREALIEGLAGFRGDILQAPPAYSAIHLDGERASDRARRGEILDMRARPVRILELELLDYDGRDARLRVRCSSGTYIRSLARDLALSIGSRARLEALERLEVGPLSLKDAIAPERFDAASKLRLLDADLARELGFGPRRIDEAVAKRFARGMRLEPEDLRLFGESAQPGFDEVEATPLALFGEKGDFRGVMTRDGGVLKYRFVIEAAS
jgi:tRNA pseudouridine55 synthase